MAIIPIDSFDQAIEDAVFWLNDNAAALFDSARWILDAAYGAVGFLFSAPPYPVVVLLTLLAGWFFVGRLFGVGAALGLWLCSLMGLWRETVDTLTLVVSSTLVALLIAIPLGIAVGLAPRATKAADVMLDFIQTMPPYIYLLPGIALLGYGPATAMCATSLVAIPPALRLTAHGIRSTPLQFRELGAAVGMTPLELLFKVRIPIAMPAILAGVNQSLMLGFGMVVIAGIVGSGGLGQAIYDAVRTLQVDRSINAGIAIVILSIVLDRFSQRLGALKSAGQADE